MFKKVLIANRGAIATRIIRTLKKISCKAVAVYAECDANSLHVQLADESWSLGDGPAASTYLDMQRIIDIALETGAEAIHPGYGFLSENTEFVRACETAGIVFIGPTESQILQFGLKHEARAIATASNTPLLPGSELLQDLNQALLAAQQIGYPVMLKSTAGGGGIGMKLCYDKSELATAFDSVRRLGANNFSNDGVFLEKYITHARHIEVQVFGDGHGGALAIGERDCSAQRRNQKVLEECPAPGLSEVQRQQLHDRAEHLLSSVNYRSAGTVEFIMDADTGDFYFLEVNTRLQVEHGVTEEVFGIDLVEWMLRLAAGYSFNENVQRKNLSPKGHAIQARIYAEDPYKSFQPSAGLLSTVDFPEDEAIRIDTWVESGIEVPTHFDPMLAKVIVKKETRDQALSELGSALSQISIYGVQTNVDYLEALCRNRVVQAGLVTTRYLEDFIYTPNRIDVLKGGTLTTIQDFPARSGYWDVGVPPSGPYDNLSFRLANRLLSNSADCAGLEITLAGPTLQFSHDTQVVVAGAEIEVFLDAQKIQLWSVVGIKAGQKLSFGRIKETGARAYLAVSGGIQCPKYLSSRSTFTLGQFGGHSGRAIRTGDVLTLKDSSAVPERELEHSLRPKITNHWSLDVIYGPHGAPDFFTADDIETFFSSEWEVHYNSSRTGIRLIGPKPQWARSDGGEAGMHPSNIHDNAYAFGTVDFTGDMPVILGPDGPSLGGFVCPATVIQADLWKLGQLRAGDKLRFRPVSLNQAVKKEREQIQAVETLQALGGNYRAIKPDSPIVDTLDSDHFGAQIVYRVAGDHFLLVEYGDLELDIRLRFRAHALMQWLSTHPIAGMKELTPGIRSLQIHYDSQQLSVSRLINHLKKAEAVLSMELDQLRVPSRIIHLPLSWDDEACQLAVEKYMQSVRKDAPWCPSNLEFIRRINGLPDIAAVKKIVLSASYLVMGLGDVYLGAPVATPLDPRHRLVTTKYNPARTWTAENSVGIGGSYLCIYGMEGPGGYQFVGRTLQIWNRYKKTREFSKPWLLRFFDQIRFFEVSHKELEEIRHDFPQGRYPLRIEDTHFSLAEYQDSLAEHASEIEQFTRHRNQAFNDELAHWHESGQFHFEHSQEEQAEPAPQTWPDHATVLDSPVSGSVWKVLVEPGSAVQAGETLLILESMKMEIAIDSPGDGVVSQLLVRAGSQVNAGEALVVLE
ncbi:MAG: urea carboxylase [Thiotrichales bacterium]